MATPVEHYETAEAYLEQADHATDPLHAARLVTRAGAHAALAAVPWAADDRLLDEVAHGLDAELVGALLELVDTAYAYAAAPPTVPTMPAEYAEGYVRGILDAKAELARLVAPLRVAVEAARS